MSAPYLFLLIVFLALPLGYAISQTFQLTPNGQSPFVAAFTDFRLLPAVVNVGTYMLIYIPTIGLGTLILALLLDVQPNKFGSVIRLIYILPGVIAGSATVFLWYVMLQPDLSPFKAGLNAIGIRTSADIFANSNLPILFAIMAFAGGFGSWVIILFGALRSVSQEVLDAAKIDGASALQIALQIKLPLISKYVTYLVILAFAGALQIFAEPVILGTLTGVGDPSWSVYQLALQFSFTNGDYATSSVIALALMVVGLGVSFISARVTNLFSTEVAE